jgi:hypothetical protein
MKRSNTEIEYHRFCASMTPAERLKRSCELGEWSKKMNKHYYLEIEKRLKDSYMLK